MLMVGKDGVGISRKPRPLSIATLIPSVENVRIRWMDCCTFFVNQLEAPSRRTRSIHNCIAPVLNLLIPGTNHLLQNGFGQKCACAIHNCQSGSFGWKGVKVAIGNVFNCHPIGRQLLLPTLKCNARDSTENIAMWAHLALPIAPSPMYNKKQLGRL